MVMHRGGGSKLLLGGLNNGQRERSERQHRGSGGQKILLRGAIAPVAPVVPPPMVMHGDYLHPKLLECFRDQ